MDGVSNGGVASPTPSGSNVTRTALVVTGVLLLGLAAYFVLKTAASAAAGDEPPIRVKGGSMRFEVLHASIVWDRATTSPTLKDKKWKVSGLDRKGDDLLVYLVPKDPASCIHPAGEHPVVKKAKKIDLLYHLNSNPTGKYEVKVHATGSKTKVDSLDLDLFLDPSKPWQLRTKDADEGYIKEIRIGGTVCTFADKDGLDSVLITEEPEEPEEP